MHFSDDKVANRLLGNMLNRKRVPSCLLFHGPSLDIFSAAKKFVLALIGEEKEEHPDLQILEPEGKSYTHTFESIRAMIGDAGYLPYSGKCRVYLIKESEKMAPYASNALLKTLEESPISTHFILLTEQPDMLLPTIASRAFSLNFKDQAREKEPIHSPSLEKLLAHKGKADPFTLETLLEALEKESEEVTNTLFDGYLERIFEERLKKSKKPLDLLEKIKKARLSFFYNMRLKTVLEELILAE